MKKLCGLVSLLIIPIVVIGQDLKALDDKYGFREAKLEMIPSSFNNIILQDSNMSYAPNLAYYFVKNADLHIGDYDLDNIVYWFYKGRLSTIEITVSKEYSNQQGVLKVLEAAYGKGEFSTGTFSEDSYIWKGEKVEMRYNINENLHHTGDIQIICKKLRSIEIADDRLIDQEKERKILDVSKKL